MSTADGYATAMSSKAARVSSQYRDGADEGSDDGSDHEVVPMIEKSSRPHLRKWDRGPRTAIAFLGIFLLASLVGNAVLLSSLLLRPEDLDAISVKHTSEYCR